MSNLKLGAIEQSEADRGDNSVSVIKVLPSNIAKD